MVHIIGNYLLGWLVFAMVLVVLFLVLFIFIIVYYWFLIIYPSMFLWCFDYCMILLLFWLLSSRLLHYFLVIFYILLIAFFFIPGFVALEPRVFLKQSLYLHEVVVRSTYILSSPDLTCGISPGMLLLLTCRLSPLYLSNALTLL